MQRDSGGWRGCDGNQTPIGETRHVKLDRHYKADPKPNTPAGRSVENPPYGKQGRSTHSEKSRMFFPKQERNDRAAVVEWAYTTANTILPVSQHSWTHTDTDTHRNTPGQKALASVDASPHTQPELLRNMKSGHMRPEVAHTTGKVRSSCWAKHETAPLTAASGFTAGCLRCHSGG